MISERARRFTARGARATRPLTDAPHNLEDPAKWENHEATIIGILGHSIDFLMRTMAKTYEQLTAEIKALQAKADALKHKELANIISQAKAAIAFYGLTASDLGLDGAGNSAKASKLVRGTAKQPSKKLKGEARYGDGQGNVWSGMGPRPRWLKDALAAGKTLESLNLTRAASDQPDSPSPQKPKPSVKLPAKYKDDAGNSWSGRGSTPRWIKAALDSGKSLEQLAV